MELRFEPDAWHVCRRTDPSSCQDNANCYAYVLNRPDYFWAVPGMGFVKTQTQHFLDSATKVFESFTSQDEFRQHLFEGAAQDGLLPVNQPEHREGHYLAALFFSDKERDFHWYRQDRDGTWSHKDGWRTPSNKDADGNMITDPRTAYTPRYPVFGGFFLVPRSGATLQPVFPLVSD